MRISGSMKLDPIHNRIKFLAIKIASRFLAATVALSLLAMLLPAGSASTNRSTMPCCVGKVAGHCDFGLSAHTPQPPPTPDPMCGLESVRPDDVLTIVAEPVDIESHNSLPSPAESLLTAETSSSQRAAESASVSQPCRMECGACSASVSRHNKRERATVRSTRVQSSPLIVTSQSESRPFVFTSNEHWARISPRGPPLSLR